VSLPSCTAAKPETSQACSNAGLGRQHKHAFDPARPLCCAFLLDRDLPETVPQVAKFLRLPSFHTDWVLPCSHHAPDRP